MISLSNADQITSHTVFTAHHISREETHPSKQRSSDNGARLTCSPAVRRLSDFLLAATAALRIQSQEKRTCRSCTQANYSSNGATPFFFFLPCAFPACHEATTVARVDGRGIRRKNVRAKYEYHTLVPSPFSSLLSTSSLFLVTSCAEIGTAESTCPLT